MQIGRLGYRVVIDPRIRSFEDVRRTSASSSSSGPAGHGPAFTSTPGTSRCVAASPARGCGSGRSGAAFPGSPCPLGWWPPFSCSNSCSPTPATGRMSSRSSCCMPSAARFRWPSACRWPSSTVLAQHPVDADLVRLRVSPATGRTRSRHFAPYAPISRESTAAIPARTGGGRPGAASRRSRRVRPSRGFAVAARSALTG